jgi:hypothetical protein
LQCFDAQTSRILLGTFSLKRVQSEKHSKLVWEVGSFLDEVVFVVEANRGDSLEILQLHYCITHVFMVSFTDARGFFKKQFSAHVSEHPFGAEDTLALSVRAFQNVVAISTSFCEGFSHLHLALYNGPKLNCWQV